MKKPFLLVFSLFLLVLPLATAEIPPLNYDGETVFINTTKAFISATPSTIQGIEPVIIEFKSKQYTGNINVVFGYNGEYLQPFRLEKYNPRQECYFLNLGELNQTEVCENVNWSVVTNNKGGFSKINANFNGKTDWYFRPNVPVVAGNTYKYRVWIEAPYLPFGKTQEEAFPDYDGKYDIALYPSSYGSNIITAYNENNLFVLDPQVDLTTGLFGYYSFDSDASDDYSTNDGSVTGATQGTTNCKEGGCYYFDGTDDRITIPNAGGFDESAPYSYSIWFRSDSVPNNYQNIFSRFNAGLQASVYVSLNDDANGNKVEYLTGSGSWDKAISSASYTAPVWNHIVTTWDGTTKKLWFNNVSASTTPSVTGDPADYNVDITIGERNDGLLDFAGYIDEFGIWDKALNSSEVSELYGGFYYPFSYLSDPFLITTKNGYNNSYLLTFNATIDGTLKSTTNGTINSGLLQNSSILHNITIIAENYISTSTIGVNVSENKEYSIYQSQIDFSCYEFLTNNSLTCTNETSIFPNAGTYNFTRSVLNYYDITQETTVSALDNRTLNFYDFANSKINITAYDINQNISISDFEINLTEKDSSYSQKETISGDTYRKDILSGRNYTFYFNKNGYVPANITINNFVSQEYNFQTYLSNSVDINIYKESDNSLITENITITFTDLNNTVTTYNTNTGNYLASGLGVTNYTIDFTSANFSTRTYTLQVTENSFQTLNAYLIASGSDQTIFTFQDKDTGATIEGMGLNIQKVINGTYQTVESLLSDITGRIGFNYVEEEPYKFTATKSDYVSRNFTLNPILFGSYIIYMEKDYANIQETDFFGTTVSFTPKKFYDGQNHSIQFVFNNPSGTFEYYGFNATYKTNTIEANGTTSNGGTVSNTLEILNADWKDKVLINFYYKIDGQEAKQFSRDYIIIDSNTEGSFLTSLGNDYGMGILERILILTFLILLVAGGAAYYAGGVASGVVAALLFGLFAYTGFVPWWSVLISLVSFFIVITWRSSE